MKKIILIICSMSFISSLNLQSMELPKDSELSKEITRTLSIDLGGINTQAWSPILDELNKLIENVLTAKVEGRLQNVNLDTIQELKEMRDFLKQSVDRRQRVRDRHERERRERELKSKKEGIAVQPPKLEYVTVQELIRESKSNPSTSIYNEIKNKENAIRGRVALELETPVKVDNINLKKGLTTLLDEINFLQQNGYLKDISLNDIDRLKAMRDEALAQWEEAFGRKK